MTNPSAAPVLPAKPPLSAFDVVMEQATDPALWFVDATITEAYLQAALRELHAAVEAGAAHPAAKADAVDAARYRWLRDNWTTRQNTTLEWQIPSPGYAFDEHEFDAAIDAAIAAGAE